MQILSDLKQTIHSTRHLRRRVLQVMAAAVALVLVWVAIDLFASRRTSLREFDAAEVARIETAMWRSYYGREHLSLFTQLAELLRTQYRLPFWRSNAVAYQASRAAFIFKDGKGRADYEQALPNLVKFYAAIDNVSDAHFDPRRAAQLELEWWIIHRERKNYKPEDLERALAELAAEVYRVPVERVAEHAHFRAAAMVIRDARAEKGALTEADWREIHQHLQASWQSLWRAVNGRPA